MKIILVLTFYIFGDFVYRNVKKIFFISSGFRFVRLGDFRIDDDEIFSLQLSAISVAKYSPFP